MLYRPGGHAFAVGLTAPTPHTYPAGHALHAAEPLYAYCPGGHTAAVALVDPDTQKWPAAHAPLHDADAWPPASPYRPAAHSPLHDGLVSPGAPPYTPAGHGVQDPDAAPLYVLMGHCIAVGWVDPGGHAYPAGHGPLQVDTVRLLTAP